MVIIHPTACNPRHIAQIERATGLLAVAGRNIAYLTLPNGKPPKLGSLIKARATTHTNHGPYGGGEAA